MEKIKILVGLAATLLCVNAFAAGQIVCSTGDSLRVVMNELNNQVGWQNGTSPSVSTVISDGSIYYTVCATSEKTLSK